MIEVLLLLLLLLLLKVSSRIGTSADRQVKGEAIGGVSTRQIGLYRNSAYRSTKTKTKPFTLGNYMLFAICPSALHRSPRYHRLYTPLSDF